MKIGEKHVKRFVAKKWTEDSKKMVDLSRIKRHGRAEHFSLILQSPKQKIHCKVLFINITFLFHLELKYLQYAHRPSHMRSHVSWVICCKITSEVLAGLL